tara:strand:- start:1637 stop:2494 length:858 start_codon:yes stop_codon:yes gene_type:complete
MTTHLLFLGTPEFSVPCLERIINHFPDFKISVISMPDKVRGRGKSVSFSPVKQSAIDHNLPVYTPSSKSDLTHQINKLSPDLVVVVAYGMIIEKAIVDTYFCINVHASLLPKYRGASPIQAALLNNDKTTGITLIKLNEFMDAGDMLAIDACPITDFDNFGSLETKLSQLGASLLTEFIKQQFLLQSFNITPQNESDATYCKKISKDELIVDQSMSPHDIYLRIRAFSPKPGAIYFQGNQRFKLLEATLVDRQLRLKKIQPEGKPPMLYTDYLLGNPKGVDLDGH